MSWRGWGRAEIMILRQCAGTMTVESIGKLIGRTGDAVRTKARELGISMILKGDFHPSAKYRQSDIELISVVFPAVRSRKNSKCPWA